jgi:hypothetical protein
MNPSDLHASAPAGDTALRHTVRDGPVLNHFLRQGPVAAHAVWTSGEALRALVCFPAGNSGTGLWFEPTDRRLNIAVEQEPSAFSGTDSRGRPLHGIVAEVAIDAPRLVVRQAVLGSVRVLRDVERQHPRDPSLQAVAHADARSVTWTRERLDGGCSYLLRVEVIAGRAALADGRVEFATDEGTALRLRLTACTGEPPLSPLDADDLLVEPMPDADTAAAAGEASARRTLAFLAYREKLLAGSWRFLTYFGRDTLMSLHLLMPALKPQAIESALASVLLRLDDAGTVAHEEDIGELAVLRHRDEGRGLHDHAVFDYKMVDDDFMLAPVVASYLLDHPLGQARAASFLAQAGPQGDTHALRLQRNADLVLQKARRFAEQPDARHLVQLQAGSRVGDWRDSEEGLGDGVAAFSVNGALVPAALRAIAALGRAGWLAAAPQADAWAEVWERQACRLFRVTIAAAQARQAAVRLASELQVDPAAAVQSLAGDGPIEFSALSLDAEGRPVPVLHCDFSFSLLFQRPDACTLERELGAMMRPFPAGLMTDAGMVVANAVHAATALRPSFGPDRYHGAVVWSWQQAAVAAGIARQLTRDDLPVATLQCLREAQAALWKVILATRDGANGELWSWRFTEGRFQVRPFGPETQSADESNAAQLWSTVYLAVRPPVST